MDIEDGIGDVLMTFPATVQVLRMASVCQHLVISLTLSVLNQETTYE